MELYPVGERFFQEFTLRQVLLNAAKNGCGPSAAGTSSRAEGYCRPCRDNELPCARGEPGADGRLCPYREHALISRQEHDAWEVLLACQGQVRLAPSGHVIGIDMDAALRIGAARSCDLAMLSELLSAAEEGLIEVLRSDSVRDGGP
jgi:hypothetical protein